MSGSDLPLEVNLPLDMELVRLVTSFTENGALALGLGGSEALKLTLAAEEVYAYLARLAEPGTSFTLRLHGGGYCVRAEFRCPWKRMELRYFNLTTEFDPNDESSLDQLGLVLAARAVDRLFLQEYDGSRLSLNLVKEKTYPPPAPTATPTPPPLASWRLVEAGPDQLKELAHLLAAAYPRQQYPSAFLVPGKLVDMVAGGEYHAALATGERGQLGGAFLWRTAGGATVRSYGPYLFGQPAGSPMAAQLVEACLARVGKSDALNLLCRYPTAELPPDYFEYLGELDYGWPDGSHTPWPHYYRQLREDPGMSAWCHPDLEPFLRQAYDRLFLPRDIHLTAYEGEHRDEYSVLAAHMDHSQGHVTLTPMVDGRDVPANLDLHVQLMLREQTPNIYVALDLGRTWHAHLMPVLLERGFEPRLLLPCAGKADELIFQYRGKAI